MGSFDFPQLTTVESVISRADDAAMEAAEGRANAHSFDKCLPLKTLFRGLPHCTCLKVVGKEFRLQPVSKALVSVSETGLEVVIKISLDLIFFTQNA